MPQRTTHQEIAARAYHLWLDRGRQDGHDVDDWLQAEYELLQLPTEKIQELPPPAPSSIPHGKKSLVALVKQAAGELTGMAETKPPRANAREVFRDYGVFTLMLLFWVGWCIRDGWFRDWEYTGFNKVMAIIFSAPLIFCLCMAISAGLALRRQNKQGPPPSDNPPANQ